MNWTKFPKNRKFPETGISDREFMDYYPWIQIIFWDMLCEFSLAWILETFNLIAYNVNSTYRDLLGLWLGSLQCIDEIYIIYRIAFWCTESFQYLVFNLLEFLLHLSIANNQLILGFFQIWTFFCYHSGKKLILQTTASHRNKLVSVHMSNEHLFQIIHNLMNRHSKHDPINRHYNSTDCTPIARFQNIINDLKTTKYVNYLLGNLEYVIRAKLCARSMHVLTRTHIKKIIFLGCQNCRVCFGSWYFTRSLSFLIKYLDPKQTLQFYTMTSK